RRCRLGRRHRRRCGRLLRALRGRGDRDERARLGHGRRTLHGAENGRPSVNSPMLLASITSFVGDHGVYAVFALMFAAAVVPAASELVMVYAGAVAGGAFAS